MTDNTKEKLEYLLRFLDAEIDLMIYEVLNDSVDDPQFSAVTAQNLVKCYISVMQEMGGPLHFTNVREYMTHNCYTDEEICLFHEKVRQESAYYIGKQY